jgi:hypothetical protein
LWWKVLPLPAPDERVMPALKSHENDTVEVHALGAAQAAGIKRRIWAQPEITSHSLLVLTPERMYLAPAGSDPRPETVTAITSGGDVDQLLGPLATSIGLVEVQKVKLDLLTNSLLIDYTGRGYSMSRVTATFATPEAADACFTKTWRRLGDGMKLNDGQRDKAELARGPLVLLFASLLVTAALALVISVFEDFSTARTAAQEGAVAVGPLGETVDTIPKTPLEGLIGWMDWRVICAVGGIVAAASQVWLYRRLTTPPVSLELVRSGA